MALEKLEGAMTALVTPLSYSDTRAVHVDYDGLEKLVHFQVENGIHGVVALGTTGQGPLLADIDVDLWKEVARLVEDGVSERVPLVIGCGSVPTIKAVKLTHYASELDVDATLHDTGYKIKTSPQGFFEYFRTVAGVNPNMQVIVYDVRSRGHPPIKPETRIRIAKEVPNARIIKDASGSEEDWVETRRLADEAGFDEHTYKILSGDDPATQRMWTDPRIRARGVISVWSNMLPHVYAMQNELLDKGRYEEAGRIDEDLSGINGIVGMTVNGQNYSNPQVVQHALYMMGMIKQPWLVHPLLVLPKEGRDELGRRLAKLYAKRSDWFGPIESAFGVRTTDKLGTYLKQVETTL
ncbi:MAG: dihydrodipicolinate synthase family protein [Candidatus Aenigmarchaeota archaeon]|nr:dihydrodipicolinate synthase family protein [Candidatus Aenigmarchaeota archaeon]